jgi:hypothetical protein
MQRRAELDSKHWEGQPCQAPLFQPELTVFGIDDPKQPRLIVSDGKPCSPMLARSIIKLLLLLLILPPTPSDSVLDPGPWLQAQAEKG